jgi:hypothetical protein
MNGHDPEFHLEIHSLRAFALFCAIVRGNELTDDKLRELTAQLKQSNTALATDVAAANAGQIIP